MGQGLLDTPLLPIQPGGGLMEKCLCFYCDKWLAPGGYILIPNPKGKGKVYVCKPRCIPNLMVTKEAA